LAAVDGGIGGSLSWNRSFVASVDMNGDGLVDLVKKENGKLNYYPHVVFQNGETITHDFLSDGIQLLDLGENDFYKGNSSTFNAQIGLSAGVSEGVGGHVGMNGSTTKSKTEIYITDANGDGLPDISINESIFFNSIDRETGVPSFSLSSENSENLILKGSAVKDTILIDNEIVDVVWPAYDVVKVWEAIHDGEVIIENGILPNGLQLSIETDNNGFYGYGDPLSQGTCRLYAGSSQGLSQAIIDELPGSDADFGLKCIPSRIQDTCNLIPNVCVGCVDSTGLGCLPHR